MEAPPGFRYIDIHTHLHPERLSRAIRRWFAERSTWKLEYPSEPEAVAAFLAARGVERFVYFSYAHKGGMAREINAWLHGIHSRVPAGIPLGTIHPDDPDMMDVAEEALVRYGFPGFKVHINVQRFFPDDPRMLPVYDRLLALDRLLLIHVGSAPWPNEYDGYPRFAKVMDRYPALKVVVAHMGSFETRQFMGLMDRCPRLFLDTTMAFAPIHHEYRRIDTRLNRISVTNDDLVRYQDRIVFGSDFPILPYPYEEERDALWLRDLPLPVYRKIFRDNAAALLALP
ncbi:MAG TPA: amidohydrolase family protein [Candidatus Bathyarchaeia archaeon]|nr:amidohydrolase family protein [Candidatus Bathyarchaeia archaeon]